MTDRPETKLPSGQTVLWNNAQIASVYANTMAIGMTPFDLHLTFGEIGTATPEHIEAFGRVKVILAPEQASNLMKLLTIAVEAYVGANGDLRSAGAVDTEAFSKSLRDNMVVPNK
jgi:hypothetical protein